MKIHWRDDVEFHHFKTDGIKYAIPYVPDSFVRNKARTRDERLEIARQPGSARVVARKYGINRTTVYQYRRELKIVERLDGFAQRQAQRERRRREPLPAHSPLMRQPKHWGQG